MARGEHVAINEVGDVLAKFCWPQLGWVQRVEPPARPALESKAKKLKYLKRLASVIMTPGDPLGAVLKTFSGWSHNRHQPALRCFSYVNVIGPLR